MAINWYPGHMVTARKEAILTLRKTDVVIEVLDARVPRSSVNPEFEKLRKENQRPALKLLNKADVADEAGTKAWLDYYNAQDGVRAIALCAKKRGEGKRILAECLALAPGRATALKPLRMMILGVPNVGKSTLMNSLLNRSVAKVGDQPAVTKMQARFELGRDMSLVDTPGMLWPGVAQDTALKLAATHSIGRNAYDDLSVAIDLADYLLKFYPDRLATRYGTQVVPTDGHTLLLAIAAHRSFIAKGNAPDLDKAASVLLHEFRTGVLGRITLELP